MNRTALLLSLVPLALSPCTGCNESGVARTVTFGRVTYDGQPIEQGHIRFLIAGKPTAQGPIENGAYRIDFRGGVPIGTGKVQVEAASKTMQMVDVGVGKKPVPMHRQLIPEKYNKQTTLRVEIVAGKENELNFELEP